MLSITAVVTLRAFTALGPVHDWAQWSSISEFTIWCAIVLLVLLSIVLLLLLFLSTWAVLSKDNRPRWEKLLDALRLVWTWLRLKLWVYEQRPKELYALLSFLGLSLAGAFTFVELVAKIGKMTADWLHLVVPQDTASHLEAAAMYTEAFAHGIEWTVNHMLVLLILLVVEGILVYRHYREFRDRGHERARLEILGLLFAERQNLIANLRLTSDPSQYETLEAHYRDLCYLGFATIFGQKGLTNIHISLMEPAVSGMFEVKYQMPNLPCTPGFCLSVDDGAAGAALRFGCPVYLPVTNWNHAVKITSTALEIVENVYKPGGIACKSILSVPIFGPGAGLPPIGVLNLSCTSKKDGFPPNRSYLAEIAAHFFSSVQRPTH